MEHLVVREHKKRKRELGTPLFLVPDRRICSAFAVSSLVAQCEFARSHSNQPGEGKRKRRNGELVEKRLSTKEKQPHFLYTNSALVATFPRFSVSQRKRGISETVAFSGVIQPSCVGTYACEAPSGERHPVSSLLEPKAVKRRPKNGENE